MYKIIAFCKWCQNLALPELAAELKKVGVDGVDLPCRPGASITPEKAREKLPEAKKIFQDHGLTLERLVTGIVEANEEAECQLEAIRAVGIQKIRLGSFDVGDGVNAVHLLDKARHKLAELQKLLQKHQVHAAIQNHSGTCLEVNISATLRLLEDCDPQWIGIQCDPGHLTISGEPVELAFDWIGPYLHSVNFKSPRREYSVDPETGHLRFTPIWVPLRDGMLDVRAVLKKLKSVGYTDPISIHGEYRTHYYYIEKDTQATNRLIADDVAYIRKLMAEMTQ